MIAGTYKTREEFFSEHFGHGEIGDQTFSMRSIDPTGVAQDETARILVCVKCTKCFVSIVEVPTEE